MVGRDQLIELIFADFGALKRIMSSRSDRDGKLDISPVQLEVLIKIWHCPDISVKELAFSLQVTGSAATQTLESLVRVGDVARTTDSVDRRIVRLSITPQGRKKIMAAKKIVLSQIKSVMGDLDAADLTHLHELLQKIITAAGK